MRLLVACQECHRQYDATDRPIGVRFRCHCGTVVQVAAPKAHDANVVRCSSCGAPRDEGASACNFCHADFTLHEQDLHTVCPQCLARVSDRARFCHHCGVALTPESAAGEDSRLNCPHCQDRQQLVSRRLGHEKVTILECGRCAGMWLGNEAFSQLAERANREAVSSMTADQGAKRVGAAPTAVGQDENAWRYRNCPVCDRHMQRRNYGRLSSVIIDLCREHGVWFDADELPRILAWIRRGGLDEARRMRAAESAESERRERLMRAGDKTAQSQASLGDLNDEREPDSLQLVVIQVLTRLFLR